MRNFEKCPHCGDQLVEPYGPLKSDVLILGDVPDWHDIMKGKAYSINYRKNGRYITRAGDILRDLLTANSIRPEATRMSNVWLHKMKKEEDCKFSFHAERALKEIIATKYVLLTGTAAVRLLLEDTSAIEWSGLEILSPDLPRNTKAMGCVKMSTAFKHLGEAQQAIKSFGEMVHE